MSRGIAFLNAPVVSPAEEIAVRVKQRRPNRNAAFCQPLPSLFKGDL